MTLNGIKVENLKPGAEIIGSRLKGSVRIRTLRYPKIQWDEVIPGQNGIIVVELVNVESGYVPEECNCYGSWKNDQVRVEFVAKGVLPPLDSSSVYEFEGDLIEDPQWGFQYQIVRLGKEYKLDTPEKIETFLRVAIGDKKTQILLEHFENPLEILENQDIEALAKIKGLGRSTAEKLILKFESNRSAARDATQLSKYELTPSQISSLQNTFKSIDTIQYLIENNPYVFIGRVEGLGWKRVDTIAINNGYNPNGAHRIAAYIDWYLRAQANEIGHLWVLLEELVASIQEIAPTLNPADLQTMLRQWTGMVEEEKQSVAPWLYYEPETRKIGLLYYRKMEEQIASELWRIYRGATSEFDDEQIEAAIKETEDDCGFEYTDQQREAIYGCFRNNVTLITGFAGVGKSFTVRPIVTALRKMGKTFAQCALSGKAGSNLAEITGEDGFTIHRLLDWTQGYFSRNENNPLTKDMVILDEISMVNDSIFLSLLRAIPTGAKLICLGDVHQLETIGPGSVCMDILASNILPAYRLTKIHRQAAQSGIITESIRVSAGEQIIGLLPIEEKRGMLQDLKIRTYSENTLSQPYVLEEYQFLLNQGISPYDIGVVVAMRTRSDISCYDLNQKIQGIVNGIPKPNDAHLEKDKQPYTIRVGDRILVTLNNYKDCRSSPDWQTDGNVVAIFNGNTGVVRDINPKFMKVELIQQGIVYVPRKAWTTIELGYALTTHKCVSEETWILTDQGPIQLKELNNGAKVGESLPLLNPPKVFNGREWEKPTHFYNAGLSDGYEITTRYGYSIQCTRDHGFDVYSNGNIIFKKAKDLKEGDYLLAPKNKADIHFNENLPMEWNNYILKPQSRRYKKPKVMTNELAQFLGMCVADGCLHSKGIKYFKRDIEIAKEFGSLLEKLFGYVGAKLRKHSGGEAWGYECSSVDIGNWLGNIGGLSPNNKFVPSCIFQSSLSVKRAFLKGYFEDGAVHLKNNRFDMIEIYTCEEKLRNQIRYLLQEVGIIGSLNQREKITPKGQKKIHYGIQIYGENARLFATQIGFLSSKKQERVCRFLDNDFRLSPQVIKFDENNVYLPIVSIRPITLYAYCLTMPQSHKFVQNGLLGSNCQGSSFPYVITALDSRSYSLLSKEWLYTALTRAKKYCCLVGQISAIRTATSTSRVIYKRTWLQELLSKESENTKEDSFVNRCLEPLSRFVLRPLELKEMEAKMGKMIPYQEG